MRSDFTLRGRRRRGERDLTPATLRPTAPRMAETGRPMRRNMPAAKTALGPRLRKSINDLKIGLLVAEEMVCSRGARLVAAGMTVDNRTLARLRDLAEINEVEHVRAPAPTTAS